MSKNNNRSVAGVPWGHMIIATGGGLGFVPVAPGTAGAAIALIIWIILYLLLSPWWLVAATIALVVVSLFLGVWTDNVMERYWGPDPRAVVIDEYFGTWVALLALLFPHATTTTVIILAVVAFALFRVIDIVKPLGCRWVDEHVHGGWGCMLDDALAGFYAAVITLIIRLLLHV